METWIIAVASFVPMLLLLVVLRLRLLVLLTMRLLRQGVWLLVVYLLTLQ